MDDVLSVAEIIKRFSTSAMSFSSISRETHTIFVTVVNRIGGK